MKAELARTIAAALVWLVPSPAPAVIIGYEGESGRTPTGRDGYRLQDDDNALGGQYIDSDHRDAKSPFGEFAVFQEYSLTLPAGTYDLWARIYCPTFFTYDSNFSDDPDSNNALAAYENDSFFVPSTLGGDPAVDLVVLNRFASSGRFDGAGNPARANVHDAWAWINVTDGVDLNGLGPTSGTIDMAPTYTATGGAVNFILMSREAGIRHDSFAFVSDGQMPTEEELDLAVLESATRGPMLLNVERFGPGGESIRITWETTPGRKYAIDTGTDLQNWDVEVATEIVATADTTVYEELISNLPLNGPEFYFRVRHLVPPPVLMDDFESGQGAWTVGVEDATGNTNWEFGAPSGAVPGAPAAANSGTNCFGTNLAAAYDEDAEIWLRSPELDLTGAAGATLSFFHYRDIEEGFDSGAVRVLDASDNSELGVMGDVIDGSSDGWEQFARSLPPAALGKAVVLEFRFLSDEINNLAGWYIDDVKVTLR
ncbi:MAG: hypothetical protein HRU37_10995 [Roseibacillus sp.]|nr:hypothetical protein [Roseibacillus sp.]